MNLIIFSMGVVLHSGIFKCCRLPSHFGHGHSHGDGHGNSHHNGHGHSHSFNSHAADTIQDSNFLSQDVHQESHVKNINIRAAFVHVLGDLIQSVATFIAALLIKFKV